MQQEKGQLQKNDQ
ncbi:hypothetical protein A2U01_0089660, partial [Trifolium medium]|nr:hypothetical protein [Trifolium medium]